jgi:hypothetical protein
MCPVRGSQILFQYANDVGHGKSGLGCRMFLWLRRDLRKLTLGQLQNFTSRGAPTRFLWHLACFSPAVQNSKFVGIARHEMDKYVDSWRSPARFQRHSGMSSGTEALVRAA